MTFQGHPHPPPDPKMGFWGCWPAYSPPKLTWGDVLRHVHWVGPLDVPFGDFDLLTPFDLFPGAKTFNFRCFMSRWPAYSPPKKTWGDVLRHVHWVGLLDVPFGGFDLLTPFDPFPGAKTFNFRWFLSRWPAYSPIKLTWGDVLRHVHWVGPLDVPFGDFDLMTIFDPFLGAITFNFHCFSSCWSAYSLPNLLGGTSMGM